MTEEQEPFTGSLWSPCCVFANGTRMYLPPVLEVIGFSFGQEVKMVNVPQTSQAIITGIFANQGSSFSLKMSGVPSSASESYDDNAAGVLSWLVQIWSLLKESKFDLYIFSNFKLSGCACSNLSHDIPLDPLMWLQDVGMDIESESTGWTATTNLWTSVADYRTNYPFKAYAGGTTGTGDGEEGGGGDIHFIEGHSMANYNGIFPGIVEQTGSGNEYKYIVGGTPGTSWKLKGLQITASDNAGATGTTTITLYSGDTTLEASVGSSAQTSTLQTPESEILIDTGSTIAVKCTAAGGHANVQFNIVLMGE